LFDAKLSSLNYVNEESSSSQLDFFKFEINLTKNLKISYTDRSTLRKVKGCKTVISVSVGLKTHNLGVNQFYRKNGPRKRESDHATDN
jgi:hypothetical protein